MDVPTGGKRLRRQRLKLSACIGAVLGILPLISVLVMLHVSFRNPVSPVLHLVFGLGVPGMLFQAVIMSAVEPHGGGTPFEMVFIIMPFNVVFYTALTYALITIVMKLTRQRTG